MSLYLSIFDGDQEVDGWTLGGYADFACFVGKIIEHAGSGAHPLLTDQPNFEDFQWSVDDLQELESSCLAVSELFKQLPAEDLAGAFEHTAEYRRGANTLYECFHNIDGEYLLAALVNLCREAMSRQLPILFQ